VFSCICDCLATYSCVSYFSVAAGSFSGVSASLLLSSAVSMVRGISTFDANVQPSFMALCRRHVIAYADREFVFAHHGRRPVDFTGERIEREARRQFPV